MIDLLILGANGQLGRDLAAAAGPDHHVTALTRADVDVSDSVAGRRALASIRCDIVANCTAFNDTAGAEADPAAAFRVNAHAVEWLAGWARERGARFVHVSTDYVFAGDTDRPYRETDAPSPINVYGASKLMGEALARRAHPDGALVVRTASLFGVAGIEPGRGNFVETIIAAAEAGGPVRVVDDVTMSPTATADLSDAILALLLRDAAPGIYHVANQGRATWYELARAVAEYAGLTAPIEAVSSSEYPSTIRRPAFSVLDTTRADAITGGLPSWQSALRRYVAARAASTRTEVGGGHGHGG